MGKSWPAWKRYGAAIILVMSILLFATGDFSQRLGWKENYRPFFVYHTIKELPELRRAFPEERMSILDVGASWVSIGPGGQYISWYFKSPPRALRAPRDCPTYRERGYRDGASFDYPACRLKQKLLCSAGDVNGTIVELHQNMADGRLVGSLDRDNFSELCWETGATPVPPKTACHNSVVDRFDAPSRTRSLYVYRRSCEGPLGGLLHVSIGPLNESPLGPGNLLQFQNLYGGTTAIPKRFKAGWNAQGEVVIKLDPATRILKQETAVSGVRVHYEI
jgi:hypothetical protein